MRPRGTGPSQDMPREPKPKLIRRHGACEPCRQSKTKCDGGQPCCSCRSEKRKAKTCEYNQKAREIAAARSRNDSEQNPTQQEPNTFEPDTIILSYHESLPDNRLSQVPEIATSKGEDLPLMFRRIALCRVVDEFMRVKPLKGHALNVATNALRAGIDICRDNRRSSIHHLPLNSKDEFNSARDEDDQDSLPLYMASLRHQLEQIRELSDTGHMREAWVACGTVIREIQAFEVETLYLSKLPLPAFEDLSVCTELLHYDCCLSFFLGCRSSLQSTPLFKEIVLQQRQEFPARWPTARLELYQTMRSIGAIDMTNEAGITQFARLAKCIVKDSNPSHPLFQISHCPQPEEDAMVHEVKLFASLVIIVIFCRLASICSHYSMDGNAIPPSQDNIFHTMELHTPRSRSSYCKSASKHAQFALKAFHRLRELEPEVTSKSWLRIYGALVALEYAAAFKLREKHVDPGVEEHMSLFHEDIKALQALRPENPIFTSILEVRRRFSQNITIGKTLDYAKEQDSRAVHHATADGMQGKPRMSQAAASSRKRSFDQLSQTDSSPSENGDLPANAAGVPQASFVPGCAYPSSETSSHLSLAYPHPPQFPSMDSVVSMNDLNQGSTTSFSEVHHPIFRTPQYDFLPAASEGLHPPLALPEYPVIHPPMAYGPDMWPSEVWSEHSQMLYPAPHHDAAMPVHANDQMQSTLQQHPESPVSPRGSRAGQMAAMHYNNVNQPQPAGPVDGDENNFFHNFNTGSFEHASASQDSSTQPRVKRPQRPSVTDSEGQHLWHPNEETHLAIPQTAPIYNFAPDIHAGPQTPKPPPAYHIGHHLHEVMCARPDLNGIHGQPNYPYQYNTGIMPPARSQRVASYS